MNLATRRFPCALDRRKNDSKVRLYFKLFLHERFRQQGVGTISDMAFPSILEWLLVGTLG